MTLPRDQIEKGFADEMAAFSALVRPLTGEELATATRCAGWTVADVAAHVPGTLADILAGRFEGLGTPEVTQRAVDERRGRTAGELADELDTVSAGAQQLIAAFDDTAWNGPSPVGPDTSVAFGVESLWYDAFIHGDDIRHALGRAPAPSDALRASVSHVAKVLSDQGWGPATLRLDGVEELTVTGTGAVDRTVTGDPMAFVLAATGRADPAGVGLDETVNIYR